MYKLQKVAFKTELDMLVSALPNGSLVPMQKKIDTGEIFLVQLGGNNTCTIMTTKKRLVECARTLHLWLKRQHFLVVLQISVSHAYTIGFGVWERKVL